MEALFTRHLCSRPTSAPEGSRVTRADHTPEALNRQLDDLEERLAARVIDAEAFLPRHTRGDPNG